MQEKVTTIYPKTRPSFNEWCQQFNVSRQYISREGINNAQRIMSLWDGFSRNKQYFVTLKTSNNEY
jgi:hypothetical protein